MKVGIGADHAGFELKQQLIEAFKDQGLVDFGTSSTVSCDYPDIAEKVARAVQRGEIDSGILVCGTGVGMAIAANKLAGVRAAACSEPYTARLTRDHNHANVLCIGARVVGLGVAEDIVSAWLKTAYSEDERHLRRLAKIEHLEGGKDTD